MNDTIDDSKYVADLCMPWSAVLEAYAKQFNITKLKRIVTGGATGQESIYNGLKAIKEDNEETKDIVVIIHDGNRLYYTWNDLQ